MKYYIQVITGFRKDQTLTIPMQEAHKAYFLFKNPEQRGVFNNGVALIGKNIQEIRPDWNATLDFNPVHTLEAEDWNEIRSHGIDTKMFDLIKYAKDASELVDTQPEVMKMSLSEIIVKKLAPNESMNQIGKHTKLLEKSKDAK